jgi:hypothetical protein
MLRFHPPLAQLNEDYTECDSQQANHQRLQANSWHSHQKFIAGAYTKPYTENQNHNNGYGGFVQLDVLLVP